MHLSHRTLHCKQNSLGIVLGMKSATGLAQLYVKVPLSYEETFPAFSSEAEIPSLPSDDEESFGRRLVILRTTARWMVKESNLSFKEIIGR